MALFGRKANKKESLAVRATKATARQTGKLAVRGRQAVQLSNLRDGIRAREARQRSDTQINRVDDYLNTARREYRLAVEATNNATRKRHIARVKAAFKKIDRLFEQAVNARTAGLR